MPVTIRPFSHRGETVKSPKYQLTPRSLLQESSPEEAERAHTILQSSFSDINNNSQTLGSRNGFVYAALTAYKDHHHLIIRPEDIWFSILTQTGFYVDKHAEELRDFFVAHEGKKELTVLTNQMVIEKVDFGEMARDMTELISQNIKDPELKSWILPSFTTTTDHDKTVASVLVCGFLDCCRMLERFIDLFVDDGRHEILLSICFCYAQMWNSNYNPSRHQRGLEIH
jgi:hypothetical protein